MQRKLNKNDAPLKIQYGKGMTAFHMGNMDNPFKSNTMQHREWQRGFNAAYYENLKRVKQREKRT